MSYMVKYTEYIHQNLNIHKRQKSIKYVLLLSMLVFMLIFAPFRRIIVDSLIPANYKIVSEEFGHMILQIEDGDPVIDAFAVFCQEIIEHE